MIIVIEKKAGLIEKAGLFEDGVFLYVEGGFSVSGTGAIYWGYINGDIADQTDLAQALDAKQDDIIFSTNGSSGAATFDGVNLNIPNYVTAWGQITGTLANQTDLNNALAGKQATISFSTTGSGAATFIDNALNIPTNVPAWGGITGTLSDQTDLNNALAGKQPNITLTTTGSSGAATFIGNTLNIPNYAVTAAWGGITGTLSNQIDLNNALAGKQATISFSTTGSGAASFDGVNLNIPTNIPVWGGIGGTLSNQIDLNNALAGKQPNISFSTTGSGAASFVDNALNIPTPVTNNASNLTTGTLPEARLPAATLAKINHAYDSVIATPIRITTDFWSVQNTYGDAMNATAINGGTQSSAMLSLGSSFGAILLRSGSSANSGFAIVTGETILQSLTQTEFVIKIMPRTADTTARCFAGLFDNSLSVTEPTRGIYIKYYGDPGSGLGAFIGVVRSSNVETITPAVLYDADDPIVQTIIIRMYPGINAASSQADFIFPNITHTITGSNNYPTGGALAVGTKAFRGTAGTLNLATYDALTYGALIS